jgi:hypothetical protein
MLMCKYIVIQLGRGTHKISCVGGWLEPTASRHVGGGGGGGAERVCNCC